MGKPQSTEELREWIEANQDAGKINGVSIVPVGTDEFRGVVSGNLYDAALLRSAPLSFTKSDILTAGAVKLLSNAIINGAEAGAIVPQDLSIEQGTEFRGFLPKGIYQLLQTKKKELGYSNSQAMTLILVYFAYDPGIEKIYRQWAQGMAMNLGCSIAEVEQAVYDHRRLEARQRRYEMSLKQGKLVTDKKVPT